VEVLDGHGVRKEYSENFLERFDTAYVNGKKHVNSAKRPHRLIIRESTAALAK
jgi:hypothetical protein